MKRISAVFRLSIGLTFLTLSIVLAARVVRIIPNEKDQILHRRQDLCEFLAIQSSLAADRKEPALIQQAIIALAARHKDLLAASVHTRDKTTLADVRLTGNLDARLDNPANVKIRVPIFYNDQEWGAVDVIFAPVGGSQWSAILMSPEAQLGLFVSGLAFISFVMYLRRALAHLDPSSVIPDRVKAMLDTLAEGVLVLDKDERILLANAAFGQIVERPAASLVGRKASTLPWAGQMSVGQHPAMPWMVAMESGASQTGITLALQNGEQAARTVVVNCSPIIASDHRVRGGMATFDDVTHVEQKNAQLNEMLQVLQQSRDEIDQKNRELQILATIDPLTGCLNRRSFFEQAGGRWGAAQRYGHLLSVLLVDVDHFKKINDTHGHSVGDQVLQHVAETLKDLARGGDLVCRYGGEEFCVLLAHAGIEDAIQAAERYRRGLEERHCAGIYMTASVGVSSMELGAKDLQTLIDQADQALYASKRAGRNRATRWDAIPPEARDAAIAAQEAARHGVSQSPIPYRTVMALHSALAHRDLATAQHSTRVAELCVRVGRQLLSAADCFTLEVAALLHDIGKLGVPDAILLKPGKLTEKEWEVMHSHDRMGVEIVAALASQNLTSIVAAHHARFDGTGDHRELPRGQDIPLGARILTVADAYDAMVSNRPYRRARSQEEAFAELRRCAGMQFDPELVETFIRIVGAEGGMPTATDPMAARIATELARLSQAMELRNLQTLVESAAVLATTAAEAGMIQISALAQRVRNPDTSVEDALAAAGELLGQCRDAVNSIAPSTESPAPAVAKVA